jgi:hypothetical protein
MLGIVQGRFARSRSLSAVCIRIVSLVNTTSEYSQPVNTRNQSILAADTNRALPAVSIRWLDSRACSVNRRTGACPRGCEYCILHAGRCAPAPSCSWAGARPFADSSPAPVAARRCWRWSGPSRRCTTSPDISMSIYVSIYLSIDRSINQSI